MKNFLYGRNAAQQLVWASMVVLVLGPTLAWGYVDAYPGRERVLMLGDSITTHLNPGVTPTARGVGRQIQEAFAGLANVHLIPENFQDTDYALSEVSSGVSHIESWINNETWDVIDFNTGLHDMKVGDPKYDNPSSYATKLGQVIDEIQAHSGSATLIWRETTFVPNPEGSDRHKAVDGVTPMDNAHRYYNTAAAPVVASKGITIVDATATPSESAPRVGDNNVHYTDAGYRQITAPVIENIYNQLNLLPGMRVDFGSVGAGNEDLQQGYYDLTFNVANSTLFVATDLGTQNHVEVTTADAFNAVDRGTVGGAGTSLGNLLRDSLCWSGSVDVTVSGLKAGNYIFTGYFHDSSYDLGNADVDVSVNGGVDFSNGMNVAYSTGASPTSIGTGSFEFAVDGINDVVFRVLADNSEGITTLNGFQITATVPEPATLTLLCLGLLSLGAAWTCRRSTRTHD